MEHDANRMYERMAELLRSRPGAPMRLCTAEGIPDFDSAVRELTALPQRRVLLAPLLFVAGEHAKEDMAGEGEGSLRSRLVRAGFWVDCALRGLGERPAVREMYVERAREAVEGAAAR